MRARFRNTILSRLVLVLLAALLVSHANGFLVFSLSRNTEFERRTENHLVRRFMRVARQIESSSDELHPTIVAAASTHRHEFRLHTTQPWGNDAASALETDLSQRLRELRRSPDGQVFVRISTKEDIMIRRGPHKDPLFGSLRKYELAAQLRDAQWLSSVVRVPLSRFGWPWQVLVSLAIMGFATVAVTGLLIRQITRPVGALAKAAETLGRGDHPHELPEAGPEEFRTLNTAFNTMNRRLNLSMTERMQILAAISHDLRTPITSLRLQAELIENTEAREQMVRTLDDMQKITEETLSFVRQEALSGDLEMANLVHLVTEVCDAFEQSGHRINLPPHGPLRVQCRPDAVRRILRNLLNNAISYGNSCEVLFEEDALHCRIVIRNDGDLIPETALEQIMQPFVRFESSRSRDTGGTGLGLPIARTLARGQGGGLRLRSRSQGGLDAILILPKNELASFG